MTRLEDLPPEVIEMIFFESLNLSLPKASLRLGNALSSSKTKIKLVSMAFSSNTYWRIKHYDEVFSKLWTGRPRSTETAIGKLQSDILSCRWATWDFMKSYYEAFLTKTIVQEFREQGLKWENGEPIVDSVVRSYVHDIVYQDVVVSEVPRTEVRIDFDLPTTTDEWEEVRKEWEVLEYLPAITKHKIKSAERVKRETDIETAIGSDCTDATDPDAGYHVLGLVSYEDSYEDDRRIKLCHRIFTAAFVARSWMLDDGSSKVAVGIGRWTGLLCIGSSLASQDDRNSKWKSLLCAYPPCQIPAKLLTGPWTTEKLHFLEAVIQAGASIASDDYESIAERGLMDAIREDNHRAVDLLAYSSCDEQWWDPGALEGTFVEPSMGWATFDFTSPMEGVSAFVDRTKPRHTCDILPTTEHLKVAVMERGCCKMIVRRLLFAEWAKIDANDRSIKEWIKGRKAASDEKGQWLQYQLEKSVKMQPRKRASNRPWYWCERDLGGGSGSESRIGSLAEPLGPVEKLGVGEDGGDDDNKDTEDDNGEEDWEDIEEGDDA